MEIWRFGDLEIWTFGHLDIWTFGPLDLWRFGDLEISNYDAGKRTRGLDLSNGQNERESPEG